MEFIKHNQLLKIRVAYTADDVGGVMIKIMRRLTTARIEHA